MMEFEQNITRKPNMIDEIVSGGDIYICKVGMEDSPFLDYDEAIKWGITPRGILDVEDRLGFADKLYYTYRKARYGHRWKRINLPVLNINDLESSGVKKINILVDINIIKYPKLWDRIISNTMIDKAYIWNGISFFWINASFSCRDKVFIMDNYYNGVIDRNLSYEYYHDNQEKFDKTFEWLTDSLSRDTMENYLRGHIEMKPFSLKKQWEKDFIDNQYFPDDIMPLSDSEVFVDCGAYTGDTFESFVKRVSNFKRYYAFEPDPRRQNKLLSIRKKYGDRFEYVPYGAWSSKDELNFLTNEGECGVISNGGENDNSNSIKVDSIDNIIPEYEDVTFIKMDIEGAELEALKGAKKTIERCKPKLAICVYHKREDLVTIPEWIKGVYPKYELYLRAHYPWVSETVLYAIPK